MGMLRRYHGRTVDDVADGGSDAPVGPQAPEAPAKSASKADWLEFYAANGVVDEVAELKRDELVALFDLAPQSVTPSE